MYSRRQLEILGEPFGESATARKATGGYILGGGGSSAPAPAPSSQTVTQTSIPEYAQPYASELFGKAQALTDINQNPYQVYGGQRIAGFNPLQQQAFQNVQQMQVSPATGAGMDFAATAGLGGLGVGQQYQSMATSPLAQQAYMSPYMQNVVDYQKTQAIQDYARQLPGAQAAATRAGAFGGSRQAIVESEAQRNLQNQLAGIQAQGTQAAFDKAQQAQQFGANLGLQGLGLTGQMAGALGQLGQQNYQQLMGINQAQQQAGAQIQSLEQQQLGQRYQDFLNQQRYPYQQLAYMSDILRGVPATSSAQTMYQAPGSTTGQLAGLGLGVGSLLSGMGRVGAA